MTETQRLIAECRQWSQGLREHPLVDVAGTNFRDRAALLDRIVAELERLQADSDRVNALERITEVNGSVGFYQYNGDWHANVAGKKRAQDRGLRGVLDYLRAWGADRDRA